MANKYKGNWAIADLVWLVALLAWSIGSIVTFSAAHFEVFQRLGSFGVAAVVAYFSYVRFVQGVQTPPGYHELSNLTSKRINDINAAVETALSNTTTLAAVMKLESERAGRETHPSVEQLASLLPHAAKLASESGKFDEWNVEQDEILKNNLEARDAVRHAFIGSEIAQAIMAVLATLQWGFGDLAVCQAHGIVQCS